MILSVGLTCLDMISVVEHYPTEDSDTRCLEHYWQRGGNASNICTVLSILKAPCSYMGTLASSGQTRFIEDDFKSHGINMDTCVYHEGVTTPLAMVMCNRSNGSRTIIAPPRSLPELTAKEFKENIDLSSGKYTWIHFEGRPSVAEVMGMLSHVDQYNAQVEPSERITTSIEIEKVRPKIDLIVDKADFVFIGKDYARNKGFNCMEESADYFSQLIREGACVICPWGEQGAMARTSHGQTERAAAISSIHVVDTLGAGDTFNAAAILALSRGATIARALEAGCLIAGTKCTMKGFEGLDKFASLFDTLINGQTLMNGKIAINGQSVVSGENATNGHIVMTRKVIGNGLTENGQCNIMNGHSSKMQFQNGYSSGVHGEVDSD